MDSTTKAWDILTTLKERQDKPYFVTHLFTNPDTQETTERTERFAAELDAARFLTDVELYENMAPVSDNVDRSKFRY